MDRVDHIRDLVADLLDVTCIETGALPVGPEPLETSLLVEWSPTRQPRLTSL